jgi:hypothetical protein
MARQQLHVAQGSTCVMSQASRSGNERSSPGMGRTPFETDHPVRIGKPDHNTLWGHWPAPLRHDHRGSRWGRLSPRGKRVNAANTTLSAYLLQPHRLLQTTFGFQDELLLVVSHHHATQQRTMQAIEQIYSEQPYRGRADPLTFLIISRDPSIETWLQSYIGDHPQFRSPIAISWDDAVPSANRSCHTRLAP